jgi:hypothetical protein
MSSNLERRNKNKLDYFASGLYHKTLRIRNLWKMEGEGKTTCTFSVSVNAFPLNFRFACYQQVRGAWSGRNGMEIWWALEENVYVVLPHPENGQIS